MPKIKNVTTVRSKDLEKRYYQLLNKFERQKKEIDAINEVLNNERIALYNRNNLLQNIMTSCSFLTAKNERLLKKMQRSKNKI